MQQAMMHEASSLSDVILLSATGSGKTVAFLVALIERLQREAQGAQGAQALILTPSRELALQIEGVIRLMKLPWGVCSCYGGHPIAEEKRSIAGSNPAIIVGTPGRILDHIDKHNFDVRGIETLVIDEFDKSLEFGFHDEMLDIISQLPSLSKRILLSATEAEQIPEFMGMEQSATLNYLSRAEHGASRLRVRKVVSPARDKIETLHKLLLMLGSDSSIIFCNHREAVDRVKNLLEERGLYAEAFHGGMEQPDRERALYKFRNGSCNIFVATDLAARGLDIAEVGHIIHYHLPPKEEPYTHRNGRTARWESSGEAYIILSEGEQTPSYLDAEQIAEAEIDVTVKGVVKPLWVTLYIGKGRKDKLSKADVAGFLYKVGGLSREDVGSIDIREHYGFVAVRRSKLRGVLKLIRGEKIKGRSILIEEAR